MRDNASVLTSIGAFLMSFFREGVKNHVDSRRKNASICHENAGTRL